MRLCARSPSSRPPSPAPSRSPSTRTHHPRRARPSHHAHDERIASTKCALGRSGQLPHQLAASVYLDRSPGRSGPKRLGSERCSTALTAPSLAEAFAAVPHPRQGRCLSTLVRCAPASSLPASHSPPELLTFASARHPLPPSGCSGCAKPLPVSPSRRQGALRTRPNSRTPGSCSCGAQTELASHQVTNAGISLRALHGCGESESHAETHRRGGRPASCSQRLRRPANS